MTLGIVIPLLVLLLAGIGLTVVATLSEKRKQLEARVLANAPRDITLPRTVTLSGPDVRVQPTEASRWGVLNWLLNMPVDLPLAHVVSPIWIFALTTGIAIATGWASHFVASWWFSVLDAVALWIVLTRGIFGWELNRYRTLLLRQMPDTIHLVISATRAGLPVSESFRTVVQEMPRPTSAEFARIVDEMALGVAADDALLTMHRRTGVTEYAIFAVTIGVQARSGGRSPKRSASSPKPSAIASRSPAKPARCRRRAERRPSS